MICWPKITCTQQNSQNQFYWSFKKPLSSHLSIPVNEVMMRTGSKKSCIFLMDFGIFNSLFSFSYKDYLDLCQFPRDLHKWYCHSMVLATWCASWFCRVTNTDWQVVNIYTYKMTTYIITKSCTGNTRHTNSDLKQLLSFIEFFQFIFIVNKWNTCCFSLYMT